MTDLEVPISVSSLRTIAPCVSGDESPKFESTWTGYYLRRLQHYQSLLDYQGTTPSLSDDLNPACNPPLYRQRVEELFERRRVEPSLEPTRRVCVELQSPHQAYSCVHVAGTNGKGSVAFKTAMDLEAHGVHKVGLYTSPHLVSVRERLIINDIPVTHAQLLALLDVVESAGERLGIQLSFFATLTTAAFFWFSVEKVDIAVIETGIGGRLDATNIINKPICSIITRIGYDHTSTLGHTLAEIAREKAGIIKEDSVVVLGPNIECQSVFVETARARRAKDVYVIPFHGEDSPSRENARIAREGVKIVLEKLGIPLLQLPLVSVNLPGRFHVLDNDTAIESIRSNLALTHFEPAFITIDVGHNADAMEALARTMDSYIKANKSYVNDFVLFVSLSNGRTPKIFQPLFNYAQRNSISISVRYIHDTCSCVDAHTCVYIHTYLCICTQLHVCMHTHVLECRNVYICRDAIHV